MIIYSSVSVASVILTLVICSTNAFNLSPVPNLILREPNLETFIPKSRSSYFGYTINLRESSVIIGAPRAQSTLKSQSTINETGAIYKCHLSTGDCVPYIFDSEGNKDNKNYTIFDGEKKDYQWLGASMDGGPKDTDKLVVCAPRLMIDFINNRYINGMCYLTSDTLSDRPTVKKVAPLRLKENRNKAHAGTTFEFHISGEQGISAHITNDNRELLIGAPCIFAWSGSIIRYGLKSNESPAEKTAAVFRADVPNSVTWSETGITYFGYSVSSGIFEPNNPKKTFFVASAPRLHDSTPEVFIFEVSKATIKLRYKFRGTEYAEYYGYAVLAEDINGDGLSDVIVTAPQSGEHNNGAVYVYITKGKFHFKLQKIASPVSGGGRFGTSVTKLGDINHDGYNDIAIGAPFAGNGAVFIYLGGPKGLREQPSQKLTSVFTGKSWGSHMFGHGLSKGTDFDKNGFNDLAIGAPNIESVFVYRAYPVVKIIATMDPLSREMKPEQTELQVNICYMISTTSEKVRTQDLVLKITIDPQVNRVIYKETKSSHLTMNVTATTEQQCRLLDATVRFNPTFIFKPIDLEFHYKLVNGVPISQEFCDECAAVDPAEPNQSQDRIIFSTGCKNDVCIADLKITSSGLTSPHILGSTGTLTVTYEVSNFGETAYLPQINITSSNKMPFAKIPSTCSSRQNVLLCDLHQTKRMLPAQVTNLTIAYDVSNLEGTSMTLTAEVSSAGQEYNSSDNVVADEISIVEFTEIEAIGQPIVPHIQYTNTSHRVQITNIYWIKSNGPTQIEELEISLEIPTAFKFSDSPQQVIDVNNITVEGFYDQLSLPLELYQDNTLLNENGRIETTTDNLLPSEDSQFIRRRRDVGEFTSKFDYFKAAENKTLDQLSDDIKGILPINGTIVFSCIDPNTTTCARAILKVTNFVPEKPVTITLKYNVNVKEVDDVLIDPWKYFVVVTKLNFLKTDDPEGKTIQIKQKIGCNVISKLQLHPPPIWWYMVGALVGSAVLATLVYGMHKVGFFRRKTREEMERLIQVQRQKAANTCPTDEAE